MCYNLAIIKATATVAVTKWTLEFITMVIKSLLTIHFIFHTFATYFTSGKGQNIKANED